MTTEKRSMRKIALVAAALLFSASSAAADSIYVGTSGTLSAEVEFEVLAGGVLQVTLTNTSIYDTDSNPEVLMAVFWDIATAPTLTYVDADLNAGSTFVHTASNFIDPSGTANDSDVAAEWAYAQAAGDLGAGDGGYVDQSYGLSAAGYDIFGSSDVLSGALHPDRGGSTTAPNGGDFGLVSAGWVIGGDSNGFINQGPHIQNAVVFLLSGFTGTVDDIGNVRFQYGTSLYEPCINCQRVPEPGSLLLFGLGAFATAFVRRPRA
jgi:hypothetical protein